MRLETVLGDRRTGAGRVLDRWRRLLLGLSRLRRRPVGLLEPLPGQALDLAATQSKTARRLGDERRRARRCGRAPWSVACSRSPAGAGGCRCASRPAPSARPANRGRRPPTGRPGFRRPRAPMSNWFPLVTPRAGVVLWRTAFVTNSVRLRLKRSSAVRPTLTSGADFLSSLLGATTGDARRRQDALQQHVDRPGDALPTTAGQDLLARRVDVRIVARRNPANRAGDGPLRIGRVVLRVPAAVLRGNRRRVEQEQVGGPGRRAAIDARLPEESQKPLGDAQSVGPDRDGAERQLSEPRGGKEHLQVRGQQALEVGAPICPLPASGVDVASARSRTRA